MIGHIERACKRRQRQTFHNQVGKNEKQQFCEISTEFAKNFINAKINNSHGKILVDTGSGLSIIRHDFAIKIGCTFQPLASNQPKCVFVANGEALRLRHSVGLELNIEGETFVCKAVVASGFTVSQDLILGLDFLRKYAAKVNFEDNTLTLGNEVLTNISVKSDKQDVLSLCDLTKIKKQTTAVVRVRIPSRFNNKVG